MGKRGVRITGSFVELIGFESRSSGSTHERAPRGKVTGFSKASRKNLLRLLSTFKGDALPIFVTLTYPAEWDPNPDVWKRDLDVFLKALSYKFPTYSAIWKLEPQKRGAPHYHLLVFCDRGKAYLPKDWVAKKWNRIVDGGLDHLAAGTRVEAIRSKRGTMWYASKYLGKEEERPEGWDSVGRYWGVMNKKLLPVAPAQEMWMESELEQSAIIGIVVDLMRSKIREYVLRSFIKQLKEQNPCCGDPEEWEADVAFRADHLAEKEIQRIEREEPWKLENSRSCFMDGAEFMRKFNEKVSILESHFSMIISKYKSGIPKFEREKMRVNGAAFILEQHINSQAAS